MAIEFCYNPWCRSCAQAVAAHQKQHGIQMRLPHNSVGVRTTQNMLANMQKLTGFLNDAAIQSAIPWSQSIVASGCRKGMSYELSTIFIQRY